MDFTFLKASGEVAFFRSDAEEALWTQEELTLNCTFPLLIDKVIERGMIILFQDPSIGDWQAFEVRNCTIMPGEFYQQLTAESIAVSELTDCHISEKKEYTQTSVSEALAYVLSGTGWNVGRIGSITTSMGNVERGSVWQAVAMISKNWNVHIWPRVEVDASGISGRYIDIIASPFRGMRMAVDKNVSDPCVTYDDSELYTALYGYGGTKKEGTGKNKKTVEYTFADVVWTETPGHPAKPYGQKYIEYPEMTALYGRQGKPRFGYYQNTDIKDPELLLEKTWESLQECCKPKISITGTVADLRRLGYVDVPIRLYDSVIVELEPVGLQFYKEIIRLTVDLLDPTKNLPEIGDYIPNIIYISRDTEKQATGGSKSNKGPGSKVELKFSEFQTDIIDTGRSLELVTAQVNEQGYILRQAGMKIDPVTGVLIYAEDNENMVGSRFRVTNTMIQSEVTNRQNADNVLSSRITQTANAIALEVSERKQGETTLSSRITIEAGRITQEVNDRTNADNNLSSRITQTADAITAEVTRATTAEGDLSGRITVNADNITAEVTRATTAEGDLSGRITVNADNISLEVTRATNAESGLSGRIDVQSDRISLVVEGTGENAHIKPASIVASINGSSSSIKISADHIILDGEAVADSLAAETINCVGVDCSSGTISVFECDNTFTYSGSTFTFGQHNVSWKSFTNRYVTLSTERAFLYGSTSAASGTVTGNIVIGHTDTTIYYLGR